MRNVFVGLWALALALALAACGPARQSQTPTDDPAAETTGPAADEGRAESVAPDPHALIGLWSFDRSCGLYDLVFLANGDVEFYDYSDAGNVVSYAGAWAPAEGGTVVLTVRQVAIDGEPTGEIEMLVLRPDAPVSDDLSGRLTRAGAPDIAFNARRCPEEDRD